MTRNRSLWAGVISAALSFAALFLPDGSSWWPGVIFGALVLAPSFPGAWRRLGLVLASTATYRAAVWLASTLYIELSHFILACALAGGLGVIALSLATAWLTGRPLDRRALGFAVLAGAISGAFLDAYFYFGDEEGPLVYVAFAACYLLWQASYSALHGLAPWRALERA